MKIIKVKWCENFIRTKFSKLPDFCTGIETGFFWRLAEESGLWEKGTYGTPMSKALENLTRVEIVNNDDGEYCFSSFHLK